MLGRSVQALCNARVVRSSAPLNVMHKQFKLNSTVRCASGVIPFKLADIGEGIAEVELLKWFVKEGDVIKSFDRVCEVQSDKATVEITSRYEGVISKVYHAEGEIVKVGSTLIDITPAGASFAVATNHTVAEPVKVTPTPLAATATSALIPFKLADIGEGIAEVEVLKWFVKEGDVIKTFDKVCEVQSDKATVEITSRFDGVVARVYSVEGDVVKVGSTLIDIRTEGAAVATPAGGAAHPSAAVAVAAPSSSAFVEQSRQAGIPASSKILTTPAVRKIAKENKVDLSLVAPTGPKGRIVKEDVLRYIQGKQAPVPAARAAAPAHTSAHHTPGPVTNTPVPSGVVPQDQRVPIRGIQRMMVKSMTESLQIPHLTYCEEVTFDRLRQLRESLKADLGKRGIKFSYMPLLIKATSLALAHYPVLNASIAENGTEMIYHSNHNIGLAMDTPKGLLVPVIKQVQLKSILDIAIELGHLQEAASKGALTEAHLSGGTFSLSNIGSIGGTYAAPVVVLPQVAIGALGRTQVLPRYVDKKGEPASLESIENGDAIIAPVSIMNVSWSADHRVVEGATIARFSNKFKNYIENPSLMVAELR